MHLTVGTILFKNDPDDISELIERLSLAADYLYRSNVHGYNWTTDFIVLDNAKGSVDYQIPNKSHGLDIELIESSDNIGFASGHNLLMRQAFGSGANAYVMINPDGFPDIGCLLHLVSQISTSNKVGLVEAIQFPYEHPKPWDALSGETDWCSGACTLITYAAYMASFGFDENFWMYCEDVDLSWRLKTAGFRLVVSSNALYFHDVEFRGSRHVRRNMLMSGRYLAEKWGAPIFRSYTEKLLVEENFYPALEYIPPIPTPSQRFSDEYPCEFRQLFSFSVPRWQ